ncbi:hypothetical protein COEREDRAFT_84067 [Coemansia reversa NRRL 1564]|uniref:Chromo domain-containing protein n=1 Tax=Coemansia reversa (strain ATCC 12441 / NRRL 1564) TaxID=763665 RepID=A0A2G5B1D5_COERN|nr:hypothetical protein COEREDRAFT_84067 [Coemansia reversa NRRL 1564]|eukprot:PIA12527.1 hypothetical protein COEREDRAFT_84067 [Coemansia reversa NRRL 1564]
MVKGALVKMGLSALTEWDFHLPLMQLALNSRKNRGLLMTPAQVMFGREMLPPQVLTAPAMSLTAELTAAHHLSDYQAQLCRQFDSSYKITYFMPGDRVLARVPVRASSDAAKFTSPFVVERINRSGAIILCQDVENGGEVPPTCNFAPQQLIHLEQSLTAPDDAFEVDFIYDHKLHHGAPSFKVHWHGYLNTEDSWVTLTDFSDPSLPTAYAHTVKNDANRKRLLKAIKQVSDSP